MLSICIPVYNNDVSQLLRDLRREINDKQNEKQLPVEIILIDDASYKPWRSQYGDLGDEQSTIILLEKNTGRAAIRNLFLQHAKYDYLLFLDGDSMIMNSGFISYYLACIRQKLEVVCGGREYPGRSPRKEFDLHWKYGKMRESKPADKRKLDPHRSFMSHNFLIRKEIFQAIHFNEKIRDYGHEDTLLGFELMMAGVNIDHIDNPVLHVELSTNDEYLLKTKTAIGNLIAILNSLHNNPEFINYVSLTRTYFRLRKYGVHLLLRLSAPLFIPMLSWKLRKDLIALWYLDLYKLLEFSRTYRAKKAVH